MKLTISLVLLGLLSGCFAANAALLAVSVVPVPVGDRAEYEPLPPKVVSLTDDTITVKYRSVGPDVQHDEAMQLVIDHCEGPYIETSRVNMSGWLTVEAKCSQEVLLTPTFSKPQTQMACPPGGAPHLAV
ncbi:hypothetical protein ACFL07_02445 [Pseudomonadota bacterium]